MASFDVGAVANITTTFTDGSNGDPVDPGQVRAKVRDPQGNITTYTYNVDPEIVRASAGIYRIEVLLDKTGDWFVRFEGKNSNRAAEEQKVTVSDTRFYKLSGAEIPDTP
jgi:hypothetical protein